MAPKNDHHETSDEYGLTGALTLGSSTHVGMKRTANEDSHCALIGLNAPPGSDALLVVADGMGGHVDGEVASAMAIQGIKNRLSRQELGDSVQLEPIDYERLMKRVVEDLNADVHNAARHPGTLAMGTTLTAAMVYGPMVIISHVGDSRAYLFRDGRMRQLTRDHSWVAEEVARGALSESEAREHPRRNILTRALGVAEGVEVDTSACELQEGDVLLLCSDGLHGLVGDQEIARTSTVYKPQQACEALVQRANELGGSDNVTVVIVRVDQLREASIPSTAQLSHHQQTTINIGSEGSPSKGLPRLLKALLMPAWLLGWLIVNSFRFMYRALR